MPRFPKREAEIVALAERMIAGLIANPTLYPNPPYPAWAAMNSIRFKVRQYNRCREELIAAGAAAEQATADKDDALENLVEAMKTDLLYAENTAHYDDDKLKLIGWAGKAAPTPLAVPGQVRSLEVPRQGDGWLMLDWKSPLDGGAASAYKVMRRERPAGAWEDVATAVITEATLVEQPKAKELEYRIVAVNKAGDGEPSNTEMVVL